MKIKVPVDFEFGSLKVTLAWVPIWEHLHNVRHIQVMLSCWKETHEA